MKRNKQFFDNLDEAGVHLGKALTLIEQSRDRAKKTDQSELWGMILDLTEMESALWRIKVLSRPEPRKQTLKSQRTNVIIKRRYV